MAIVILCGLTTSTLLNIGLRSMTVAPGATRVLISLVWGPISAPSPIAVVPSRKVNGRITASRSIVTVESMKGVRIRIDRRTGRVEWAVRLYEWNENDQPVRAVVDVVTTSAMAYRRGFLGDDLAILAISPSV